MSSHGESGRAPEATTYRLSLYHCYLGELLRSDPLAKVTSGRIAVDLDIRDETVRRDIAFVGSIGRPGAGYMAADLHGAIQEYLGLVNEYPIIRVGSVEMLHALGVVFPPSTYGVKPVGYFTEHPSEVGSEIDGIKVAHVSDIPLIVPDLAVDVALIACSPEWVQLTVNLCARAGVTGVLLLTPVLMVDRPDGMTLTQIRMPCDIKSLACRCRPRLYGDDE